MPANKNQRIRCLILDKCFRNKGRNYQIDDLIEAVNEGLAEALVSSGGVSRRTIYNDIEFMQTPEGGLAEIKKWKDGVKTYYRYEDQNFSIAGNPFNEEERKYLKSLVNTLSNMKGIPQMETLMEAISKIDLLSMDKEKQASMEFEENPYIDGMQHLQHLNNAILSKSAQEVVYEPYGKEARTYRFHPQYLKQYNQRWYVFGVRTGHEDSVSNFPLDRILSLKPINDEYIEQKIDWEEYFDDIIGVSKNDTEMKEVHLLVHGRSGYYIAGKPLHSSQRSHWIDKETLDVRIDVMANYELMRTLLSYAGSITILGPESLREEYRAHLEAALERNQ